MLRRISSSEYIVWFGATIFYIASTIFLFPYFLKAAVLASTGGDCAGGGACGALATVIAVYVKPVLVLIGIVLIVLAAWKRLRGRFSPFWTVFAAGLALAAAPHLYAAGNFWAANFAAGIMSLAIPFHIVALLLFGVLLSLDIEDAPGYTGSIAGITGPMGFPSGKFYGVTAAWIVAIAAISLLSAIAIRLGLSKAVFALLQPLLSNGLYWLLGYRIPSVLNVLAGFLLIAALYSGQGRDEDDRVAPPRRRPGSGEPGDRPSGFGRRNRPAS